MNANLCEVQVALEHELHDTKARLEEATRIVTRMETKYEAACRDLQSSGCVLSTYIDVTHAHSCFFCLLPVMSTRRLMSVSRIS